MKRDVLLIVAIISIIIAVAGCVNQGVVNDPREARTCRAGGGEWKTFSNGCVDSCHYVRSPGSVSCIQVFVDGCECGLDKCWNGQTCETNEP